MKKLANTFIHVFLWSITMMNFWMCKFNIYITVEMEN